MKRGLYMNKDKPIGVKINQTGRLFKKTVRDECNKRGINGTYSVIIMNLSQTDGLSQNELVHRLHLAAPTISLTLRNMENEGLINRTNSLVDSRKTIVKLTEKGYQCDEVIKECFKEVEKRIIKDVKEVDLEVFNKVIDQILINLMEEGEN